METKDWVDYVNSQQWSGVYVSYKDYKKYFDANISYLVASAFNIEDEAKIVSEANILGFRKYVVSFGSNKFYLVLVKYGRFHLGVAIADDSDGSYSKMLEEQVSSIPEMYVSPDISWVKRMEKDGWSVEGIETERYNRVFLNQVGYILTTSLARNERGGYKLVSATKIDNSTYSVAVVHQGFQELYLAKVQDGRNTTYIAYKKE